VRPWATRAIVDPVRRLAGELTDHQQQILNGIAEQRRSMTRVVNGLMDISRLESGSFRMGLESTHVADLVTGLVRSFDVLAAEKRCSSRCRTPEPESPRSPAFGVKDLAHRTPPIAG